MAASQTSNREEHNELSDIKRKLAWRMGFAGLMIIALLGGLAMFDYLSAQRDAEPSAPAFNEPVPVPKKTVTQPVTPAEPSPEANKEEKKESKDSTPESSAAPVDKSAPVVDLPPRPEVAAQPVLPQAFRPGGKPASASQPAASAPTRTSETKAAPVSAPAARAEPPIAAAQPQPAPPRLFSGYALQAGVFSDPRRAEELHAKLTLEGIPSTIEARVQVGPFKNKEEAEAAREKMKALGIDAVMLMPKGAKR